MKPNSESGNRGRKIVLHQFTDLPALNIDF